MLFTWHLSLLAEATSTGSSFAGGIFRGHWKAYVGAFAAIFFGLLLRKVISEVVITRLAKLSEKTKNEFDDLIIEAVRKPLSLGVLFLGIWVAFWVGNWVAVKASD